MTRKPTKRERALLERRFVFIQKSGKRCVGGELVTNAAHITHADLCKMERKGLITFEDAGAASALFGLRCWRVRLTDAGMKELET